MFVLEQAGYDNGSLTHSQTPIWIGQRLNPNSPLYNMAFAWVISADVHSDLFQQAWCRVANASDVLKTAVVERGGEGRRLIGDSNSFLTEVLDFRNRSDAESAFRDWCRERCTHPFSLEGPLVDSVLVRLGKRSTGWYLNLHHLITDAWSTVLLYRQVAAEYAALLGGVDGRTPQTLVDYYPAAAALGARTSGWEKAREHWLARRQAAERAVPVSLYGWPGRPVDTRSTRLTLVLDAQRQGALDRLCTQPGFAGLSRDMSRFALFATLLSSWLYRVSGQSDLVLDAPVAGRASAESKRALGVFIEMFPFAVSVEADDSFRSLGAKCLQEAELFLRHALPGSGASSGSDASNIVLNYFPEGFGDFAGVSTEVEWVHPGHGDSVHALRLQIHDFNASGRLTLHFDYNDKVLPEQLRRRGLAHFDRLLAACLDDPDGCIAKVDLLTAEEHAMWAALNVTSLEPLPDRTVIDLFRAQAGADPGRIAMRQAEIETSFGRLQQEMEALAARLIQLHVQPGDRVAILSKRSMLAVVAVLAVLRVRAAYVPIDPAYPANRVATIIDDSAARVLLVGDGIAINETPRGINVESIAEGIQAGQGHALDRTEPALDDLAYMIYTSGSTGRPKGVLIEHAGLADYLLWASRKYVRGDYLTFPLFTSMAFDLTITSLFLPLITGGTLEIYPETEGPVDSAVIRVAAANTVDFIKLTPSHLVLLAQLGLEGSRIRRMVVGGEDLKSRLAADISTQLHDHVEIYNEYGPTEAVVGCVLHRFDPDADTVASVPIGVPADHVAVEILNEALSPVPQGVPGELWISRHGLARGYHGLDTLSNELFPPHPDHPGHRRYRSGDRVRLNESGNIEYLGRLDRQLKVTGFRIEPGEIEAAMLAVPAVTQCAVVADQRGSGAPGADETLRFCRQCGLPSNYPGAIFDEHGVCDRCRSYVSVKEHAQGYFRTMGDLRAVFAESRRLHAAHYDCMMLLSGGKDSTYALCQLVDMGLSVYAFTLDNGFISDAAKDNIRRVAQRLEVPVEFAATPAMNAIFRDSLQRFSNVCNGCFKTIYTLSTNRALELKIPIIVTGLSRGQMFETRLTEEMFRDGRRSPEEVDAAVLAARKRYHRVSDEVSRSLDVSIFQDDRVFEQVGFVDFYRYCDVGLDEMYSYLGSVVPWVRPKDTGRSTNCRINDVGIYIHKRERGYHNYALPYSWDVRLGHKEREAALHELNDEIDITQVKDMLAEIGYDESQLQRADSHQSTLTAFYVADGELDDAELRRQISERLPAQLVPAHLQRVDSILLTAHGKVDEEALKAAHRRPATGPKGLPPQGPVAEYLAQVWLQTLGVDGVGTDDDFFELGGTSLMAMQVMVALCNEFAIELPLDTLFSYPTLGALARIAEDRILDDVAQQPDLASGEPPLI